MRNDKQEARSKKQEPTTTKAIACPVSCQRLQPVHTHTHTQLHPSAVLCSVAFVMARNEFQFQLWAVGCGMEQEQEREAQHSRL
jgi:hypothetical protein